MNRLLTQAVGCEKNFSVVRKNEKISESTRSVTNFLFKRKGNL